MLCQIKDGHKMFDISPIKKWILFFLSLNVGFHVTV